MKNSIKQFAAALIVVIFTAVTIFSMAGKSETVTSKNYKQFYGHVSDTTPGDRGGNDTTDGSGGPTYPPKD